MYGGRGMRKSAFFQFTECVLALLLIFCATCPAAAVVSLSGFEQQVAGWQNAPVERARQLSDQVEKMQAMEEGLARQNNISVTRVLRLEQAYIDLQNYYYSIFYIQKHSSSPASFQTDDDQLRTISSQQPPYTYLFYLDALQAENAGLNEIKHQQSIYDTSFKNLQPIATQIIDLEKQYRIAAERVEQTGANVMIRSWELQEIAAQLEICLASKTFYTSCKSLAENDLAVAHTRYDAIFSMIGKIRRNIIFSDNDFLYLDSLINGRTARQLETIKTLDARYKQITALLKGQNSGFVQYRLQTERELVEEELLLLEDMMEYWYSLRSEWRMMRDVLSGKLSPEEQKKVAADASDGIIKLDEAVDGINRTILGIDEAQRMAIKRFGGKEDMSPDDSAKLGEFLDSVDSMKNRMLGYTIDCGTIKSYYSELDRELRIILHDQNLDNKSEEVVSFWRRHIAGLLDVELWHFGDLPLTVGKLLYAFFTFIIIMVAALCSSYLARRRAVKKNVNKHNVLLMVKFIDYVGFVLAFLCALWSLRIPLTAFAFLGGAVAIAIGFGTQKVIGDIFSGIMMLFQKKLRVGDQVIIGDRRGIVTEITLQNTVLLCEQSKYLIIPNSKVQDSEVVNLTLNNPRIRVEFTVGIAYESDTDKAMRIMKDVLDQDEGVLEIPASRIFVGDLADSAVQLIAQFYVDLRVNSEERNVQFRLLQKIRAAFEEAGIKIPYPQTDVHIKNS